MPILVCTECTTEFEWDESPSDDRCVECAMRRAAYFDDEDVA